MKKILPFLMILMVLFAFVVCGNDGGSGESQGTNDGISSRGEGSPGGDSGESSVAIGCANLDAGTRCEEDTCCGSRFLCLTGQGSDSNCGDGCSCQ